MKKKADTSLVDNANNLEAHKTIKPSKAKTNKTKVKNQVKESTGDLASILLPADYRPSESEEFMGPMQLLYFRNKLEAWKSELLDDASETITGLSQENLQQEKGYAKPLC